MEWSTFESLEPDYLKAIKDVLDEKGMERVLAWGHPDGLEAGRNTEAWREMNELIPRAQLMGAEIMRSWTTLLANDQGIRVRYDGIKENDRKHLEQFVRDQESWKAEINS